MAARRVSPFLTSGMVLSGVTHHVAAQTPPTSAGPARRSILIYSGGPERPVYSIDDFVHMIAFVDTGGKPSAWLCDGAILLEYHARSGHYMMPWTPGYVPSDGDDWLTYLDSVLAPGGPVTRLDSAVGLVAAAVGGVARPFALTLMMPYPDPRIDTLRFEGQLFHFRGAKDRVAALDGYATEALKRIRSTRLSGVRLTGFYWINEGITAVDTAVVTGVSASVHRRNLEFVWIPAWGAAGAEKWHAFGFDQASQQPNYFFHWDVPVTRLDSAVARARATGMGLELEFDRRMFGPNWQFWDRLEPYLSALAAAPDLRSKPITIYEASALMQLARSRDAWHRALYERLANVLRASAADPSGQ